MNWRRVKSTVCYFFFIFFVSNVFSPSYHPLRFNFVRNFLHIHRENESKTVKFHSIRRRKWWVNSTRKNFHIQNSRNEKWTDKNINFNKNEDTIQPIAYAWLYLLILFLFCRFTRMISFEKPTKIDLNYILNCMNGIDVVTTIASVNAVKKIEKKKIDGCYRLYTNQGTFGIRFFFFCNCIRIFHLVSIYLYVAIARVPIWAKNFDLFFFFFNFSI